MLSESKLLQVSKPGRYIGNEINIVQKNPANVAVRFAFCFPDVYEIGMSNLGLQIMYFLLNERTDTFCERVFMPWTDMLPIMQAEKTPLWALETGDPINNFSFLGFTLQHELSFTNVLAMLDLAGLPLHSNQRTNDMPIVCAGGPCACNPEPMASFVDFFYIGDGEATINSILDIYCENKRKNGGKHNKQDFLADIANLSGVYVPAFYQTTYNNDGTIAQFTPIIANAPKTVQKTLVKSLDETFFPDKMLVPLIDTAHNRVSLELFRGCKHGCKFCQASATQRPIRYRKPETLLKQAQTLLDNTGHEEISLVSLSTSDYPWFTPLLDELLKITAARNVNISLPSLRLDAVSLDALQKTQEIRRSSLTFAPEAGTQRLRDVIRKNITALDINEGCRAAFAAGFDRIKLYFMTGLPTETDKDLQAIALLSQEISDEYYLLPREQRRRPLTLNVSCSCFVPKPFTPFQWESQDTAETFIQKQKYIKDNLKNKRIVYRYHDAKTAVVEGVLSRGDRRVAAAIESAYKKGAIFDSWTEVFSYDLWEQAFAETGVSPEFYAYRKRDSAEILPWNFIKVGDYHE
ncbi:MAG: TIGR03960 family B12-binding radical SAM protein [Defluviitaleaceae bacterium]|nr:TIGR03960 family B12-binding radical SAM protein [Defluviitaleaceae bacterium]